MVHYVARTDEENNTLNPEIDGKQDGLPKPSALANETLTHARMHAGRQAGRPSPYLEYKKRTSRSDQKKKAFLCQNVKNDM